MILTSIERFTCNTMRASVLTAIRCLIGFLTNLIMIMFWPATPAIRMIYPGQRSPRRKVVLSGLSMIAKLRSSCNSPPHITRATATFVTPTQSPGANTHLIMRMFRNVNLVIVQMSQNYTTRELAISAMSIQKTGTSSASITQATRIAWSAIGRRPLRTIIRENVLNVTLQTVGARSLLIM